MIEQILDWIIANPKTIIDVGVYSIALASVVVKLTPTKKDDHILMKIVKVLSLFKDVKKRK